MHRTFFGLVLALAMIVGHGPAMAWPERRVTIIVPFPAGGTTDVMARLVGQGLSELWKQPVIIENRPGAGGNVGTQTFVQGNSDPHTLLMHTSSLTVAPSVYRQPGFDVTKDLTPVVSVGTVPFLLAANPSVPAKTPAELAALLKTNNGATNYASNGAGTIVHLAFELYLKDAGGLRAQHIPFRGSAPAITELLGGRVDLMIDSVVTLLEYVRTGQLRAIAVTSKQRFPALPDVPTFAESGVKDYEASSWYGFFARADAPAAIVDQVSRDVGVVLAQQQVRERLTALGVQEHDNNRTAFAETVKQDLTRWRAVTAAIGLKPE